MKDYGFIKSVFTEFFSVAYPNLIVMEKCSTITFQTFHMNLLIISFAGGWVKIIFT